ncbi:FxSxx-COOH cyclophane-containing RiPP peptide [Streptomyces sp. NPDC127106]|uniref:FxSxx-COOH cyclophane-containing RiPP peptide n=1 Tax=Streptomyces sp. NPDC127106 TaxID=3345360 RepID=UPI003640F4D4
MVIRHQTPHTEATARGTEGETAPGAGRETVRERGAEADAGTDTGTETGTAADTDADAETGHGGAARIAGADPGAAPAACTARLPDLSGYDLAALRGIDHPVLARVIEAMVERVTHPAEILNAFDSGVS